ncbi:MFS transporter [Rhodococcus sp. IEGM 1408]|uniref:MFS transporter n=1 Tax=Rhodococcus sp. IEGM 1408 TaxID=3082220 RepID=UPI00295373F2|nr:MFS transporter [Rhodococcus sp. IEGM 1408]MDV8002395.1 MFS transporter [Rhodococcus sp. IEGM 1408]
MCIAQTTSWGLLFYSLPAAVTPISQDTGWSDTAITGALSAGLVISAVAGLRVGSVLDARGPRTVMTLGAVIGVAALALVAWSPNLPMFYLAWLVAGFAQSAVLYPPAFAVITRWYGPRRVGPLLTLTLVAGFASTLFAPLTAYLIGQFGWRTSYLIMAGILAAVSVPLHALFLNSTWSGTVGEPSAQQSRGEVRRVTRTRQFITLQVVMTVATFTLFAVTINLIPLLLDRGIAYSTAALAFGLVGAGQVVGRLGYPALARRSTPQQRTLVVLGAGALGLWGLALLPGPTWLLVALAVGTGAARGCHTLLQATAVSDRWGTENFGAINAVFAAPMTAVTALAPVSGPVLAGLVGGYPAMAVLMAVLLTATAAASIRT